MTPELSAILPWLCTVAAIVLLVIQGIVQGRRIRALRTSLKERCDALGREVHATTSGSLQFLVVDGFEFDELSGHWNELVRGKSSWGVAPSTPSRSQRLW